MEDQLGVRQDTTLHIVERRTVQSSRKNKVQSIQLKNLGGYTQDIFFYRFCVEYTRDEAGRRDLSLSYMMEQPCSWYTLAGT